MGCVPFPHPFALYSYCGGNQEALEPLANSSVSEAGVGFIKKLLAPQAGDRPTSGEAEELPWIEEAKRVAEFQDMSGPNRSADEEWKARFENLREEYEDLKKQAKYHLEAMQKQHQADLALGKRRLEEEEVRLEKLQEEHEHFKQQSEYRLEAMRKQHQADLALEQRRFKEEKEMLKFDHSKEILGNRMKKEKDETHSLRLELRHILEQYRAEKQQMEDHADDLANQLADMTRRYHAEKEKNMVKLEKSQREEVEKAKASSTLPQLRKEENAKPLKTLVVPTHTIHARDSRDRTTSRVTRSKPRLGGHGEMEVGWLYRIVGEYANEYSYDREITEIQRDTNTIITVDEEISRDGDEEYREVTIIGTEANRARAAERLHAEAY